MRSFYKKYFAVTDAGAEGLAKASRASFLVYMASMLPAFLVMLFAEELLLKHAGNPWMYAGGAAVTLVILYLLLWVEYDRLYNATYQESANLRTEIAETLGKLPLSYFSRRDLSDLAQTIMADVAGIEHAMSHSIPKAGGMALFFPLVSVLLLWGNVKMGLAVILPTLFSFGLVVLSKRFLEHGIETHYQILRENSEAFQETIEMQQEIRSFNLSEAVGEALCRKMEESEKVHLRAEAAAIAAMSLSSAFSFVSLVLVIITGVMLMERGEITVVYLLGYLLGAIKIKEAVDASKEGTLEIYMLAPKIRRIREIRETVRQEGREAEPERFDIELSNVSFSYDKDIPVLEKVSFTAKQGEVTALAGPSGCGKTTVLKLVSKLYDCDSGTIYVGGRPLQSVSAGAFFRKVSVVFQDVTLFNASVLENIRLGRPGATDAEVRRAAELAHCAEFIERMEHGYDTLIGENGAELSGGERQRLSIARAFLKDAPVLILDEIAANLDVENEKKIQESLNRLIAGKTVIIISHRLKSVENTDKIVVLDAGCVECIGRHEKLLEKSRVYRNLVEKMEMTEAFVY